MSETHFAAELEITELKAKLVKAEKQIEKLTLLSGEVKIIRPGPHDCPKCWDAICKCGYKYERCLTLEELEKLIPILLQIRDRKKLETQQSAKFACGYEHDVNSCGFFAGPFDTVQEALSCLPDDLRPAVIVEVWPGGSCRLIARWNRTTYMWDKVSEFERIINSKKAEDIQ